MAKLRELIPRDLFIRTDTYERELDKVFEWQNVSDEDIKEIYRNKTMKQHGASSSSNDHIRNNRDPFAAFRGVPDFHKPSMDHQAKQNSSNVSKLYKLQGKIAGKEDTTTTTN